MTARTYVEHGTRSRYVGGCRCVLCTNANRVYRRAWIANRVANGWRVVRGRWTRP